MAGQKISAMSLVAAVTDDMKFPTDQSDGDGGNLAATAEQIADFVGATPGGDFWPLEGEAMFLDNVTIDGDGNDFSLDNFNQYVLTGGSMDVLASGLITLQSAAGVVVTAVDVNQDIFTVNDSALAGLISISDVLDVTYLAVNLSGDFEVDVEGQIRLSANEIGDTTEILILPDSIDLKVDDNTVLGVTNDSLNSFFPHTFNRSSTRGNINIDGVSGDVSAPENGDVWLDSVSGKFRIRENSTSFDLIDILTATVSVTSIEILLSNTPKTIIAAPGSDKFIQVLGIDVVFTHGGVTYAGGGTGYFFKYNNAGTALNVAGFSVSHAADRAMRCEIIDDTFGQATASVVNQPVTISSSGNYTTGNGTFKIYIVYKIVTL